MLDLGSSNGFGLGIPSRMSVVPLRADMVIMRGWKWMKIGMNVVARRQREGRSRSEVRSERRGMKALDGIDRTGSWALRPHVRAPQILPHQDWSTGRSKAGRRDERPAYIPGRGTPARRKFRIAHSRLPSLASATATEGSQARSPRYEARDASLALPLPRVREPVGCAHDALAPPSITRTQAVHGRKSNPVAA
jgi:hypothetical protein